MAKTKVKVGVYTKSRRAYGHGYDKPDLISEEQYEELVADRKKELVESESDFEDYLEDNYCSYKEIFDMDEDEKAEVRAEYADKCADWAREDLEEDWDYEEFETEVEIPAEVPSKQPKGKCPCPCNR
jgi:hypothetical protein